MIDDFGDTDMLEQGLGRSAFGNHFYAHSYSDGTLEAFRSRDPVKTTHTVTQRAFLKDILDTLTKLKNSFGLSTEKEVLNLKTLDRPDLATGFKIAGISKNFMMDSHGTLFLRGRGDGVPIRFINTDSFRGFNGYDPLTHEFTGLVQFTEGGERFVATVAYGNSGSSIFLVVANITAAYRR